MFRKPFTRHASYSFSMLYGEGFKKHTSREFILSLCFFNAYRFWWWCHSKGAWGDALSIFLAQTGKMRSRFVHTGGRLFPKSQRLLKKTCWLLRNLNGFWKNLTMNKENKISHFFKNMQSDRMNSCPSPHNPFKEMVGNQKNNPSP